MIFDFYAELAIHKKQPSRDALPDGLVSGFVDECAVWTTRGDTEKNEAREFYTRRAVRGTLALPPELELERWPPKNGDSQTYEEGGKGALHLLYAPWPGMKRAGEAGEMLGKLLEAIDTLLKNYGISAKRSVGWGTAEIKGWQAWRKGTAPDKPMKANDWRELWRKLLDSGGGA